MWGRRDSQEVGLEAAILERVRNSSLVKRSCADNSPGLKRATEAAGGRVCGPVSGRGAFRLGGRSTGRTAGRGGRDDAGTSSDQDGENPSRRKPKGSWGRFIRPGLVGPKPRPRGVGEGQSVNIPIPPFGRLDRRGDAGGEAPPATGRAGPSHTGAAPGKAGAAGATPTRGGEGEAFGPQTGRIHTAEKTL